MSYYDVDAILTDAQKLPCTFEIDVPGLGYLDGNPGSTVMHSCDQLYLNADEMQGQSWYQDRSSIMAWYNVSRL